MAECSGDSIPFHDYNCPVHGHDPQEGNEVNTDTLPEDIFSALSEREIPTLGSTEEIDALTQQVRDLEDALTEETMTSMLLASLYKNVDDDFRGMEAKGLFMLHTLQAITMCPDLEVIHATAHNAITAVTRTAEEMGEAE